MYDYDRMLKCIRCSTKDHIKPYKLTVLTNIDYRVKFFGPNKRIYNYEKTEIPVCPQCYRAFENWMQYKCKASFSNVSLVFCGFFLLILISFIFMHNNASGVQHLWYIVISFLIIFLIPLIYSNMIRVTANKMDSNPWRYVKIKGHGKVFIKPFNSSVWILYNMWIPATLTERMVEEKEKLKGSLYCEKCGNLIEENDRNCKYCGSRNLK